MKFLFLVLFFSFISLESFSQKPKNGTYTYKVAFAEWNGKSHGATVLVKIKGDSITVINNGTLSGTKGEILEKGIIRKHKKTGQWIISNDSKDIEAAEVGGCTDGPPVIDFKKKIFWLC